MNYRSPVFSLLPSIAAVLTALFNTSSLQAENHGHTLSDVLRMQQLSNADVDPTGRTLVFALTPPYEERKSFSLSPLSVDQDYAGRLYEYRLGGSEAANTFGDAGWAMAGFYKDGSRMAVHFTREGRLHAGVWDFTQRRFYPLEVTPEVGSASRGDFVQPIWLNRDELIYYSRLDPGTSILGIDTRQAVGRELMRRWETAWAGKISTASVLESPLQVEPPGKSTRGLVRVKISTGEVTLISAGKYSSLALSPAGDRLLATRASAPQPFDPQQLPGVDNWIQRGYEMVLFDLSRQKMTVVETDYNILNNTFAWDRHGRRFVAYGQSKGGGSGVWLLGDAVTGKVVAVPHIGLDLCSERERGYHGVPEQALPIGEGIAMPARAQDDPKGAPRFTPVKTAETDLPRVDWYYVKPDGTHRALTEKITPVSPVLASIGTEAFYISGAGRFWRVSLKGRPVGLTGPDYDIYFKRRRGIPAGEVKELYSDFVVCSDRTSQAPRLFVDLNARVVQPIKMSSDQGRMLTNSTVAKAVVLLQEGKGEWVLSVAHADGKPELVQSFNHHLSDVHAPERVRVTYKLADGQEVDGQAVLPVDFKKGRRAPVVVSIYPDVSAHRAGYEDGYLSLVENDFYSTLGYIVLYPYSDIPILRKGDNPLGNWAGVTLPAIDRLVEMGLADPDRVVASGFSQGSWSVLALIEQTDRFKAASAGHGYSDFISAFNQVNLIGQVYADENWGIGDGTRFEAPGAYPFIGGTPWDEPMKYVEASPLFGVRRITTPLLLSHSDMDTFFSMSQFDELFTAMTRLKKRVQYVRYWGEEHLPTSPANIRDYWAREISWFDEFCDISRDANGQIIYEENRPKSRNGEPPLTVEQILKWKWFFGQNSSARSSPSACCPYGVCAP